MRIIPLYNPLMALTLPDLAVGDRARVVAYGRLDDIAQRLISLGLTPGTAITLKRFAPFGDPVEIHFRGFRLALRPREASCLELERA